MNQPSLVKRDTAAWIFQVWLSFLIAFGLCAYGIFSMQKDVIYRVFLSTSFFFCLSSSFVLAKCIRDNQYSQVDTMMWRIQVWAAFGIAFVLAAWGLNKIDLTVPDRNYMIASGLFLLSSTFTLTKTVRDKHEADVAEGKVRDYSAHGSVDLDKDN